MAPPPPNLSSRRPRRGVAVSGLAGAAVLAVLAVGGAVTAQPIEDAPLFEDIGGLEAETVGTGEDREEDDPTSGVLVAEFGLEERNVVLSAAKTKTTIQEAPAIVSVITAEDIKTRGYRTVNDVLQSVPGFEGDRWESNGWTEESFARGNPRGLLILLNGVNIVEPLRNVVSMDRKIPMEAIERIEVVSGPGGVLWGSNALLGVVNIITKDADSDPGFRAWAGAGTGLGEQEAAKVGLSYGGSFLSDKLKIYGNASFFTTNGALLTVDAQKVVGALPEPTNDATTLYVNESLEASGGSREFFVNFLGAASFGDVTVEWMLPFEQDYRQVGTGGAVLTSDLRADPTAPKFDLETAANDDIRLATVRYQSRFAEDTFGLSAKAFYIDFAFNESPFGAFPQSDVSPRTARGVVTALEGISTTRFGLNLDMDLALPFDNSLTFGAEVFRESTDGLLTTNPVTESQVESLQASGGGDITYRDGLPFFTEFIVSPVSRTIGAAYVRNEFKASSKIALSGGARFQVSDSYDPSVLFSAASVWNIIGDTYLKLNYAEGFRPPNWQSTHVNGEAVSGITFQPNPELEVETSRAGELELNTVLFKGDKVVKRLYIRADYALTLLDKVITQRNGLFRNTGTRLINSAELFARLELRGGHELWTGYYFVDVDDAESGRLRQVANNIINVGAKGMILEDLWELSTLLTWIGPREDLNRNIDPEREPFFVDCPAAGERACTPVQPTDLFFQYIEPVWLLRVGTRVLNIYDRFTVSAFGYNVLDQEYLEPDLNTDDRIATRSYPKPRWSFFVQAEATF